MLKFATAVLVHHIFVIGTNKWKLWNTALEFHFLERDGTMVSFWNESV